MAAVIGTVILLCGCGRNTRPAVPEKLIPPAIMQDLLTDMLQLEGTLRVCEREHKEQLKEYAVQQWDSIQKKYGINEKIWKVNYSYYMSGSDLSDTLFTHVANRLSEIEAQRNEALRNAPDSILRFEPEDNDLSEFIVF